MSRTALASALVSILLFACTQSGTTSIDTVQAVQIAQEMREGCVGASLDLLQNLADRLAPLAYASSPEELQALAAQAGCTVTPGVLTDYLLCEGDPTLEIQLSRLDGVLIAEITADTTDSHTEGVLEIDPAAGVAMAGDLVTEYANGCTVLAFVDRVQGQLVADLPGTGTGLIFTGGSVALHVLEAGDPFASGTAALVGRRALVILEIAGIFAQGEIDLA